MAAENSNIVVEAVGLTKIFKDFWGRPKARAVNSIDFHSAGSGFGLLAQWLGKLHRENDSRSLSQPGNA